MEQLKQISPQLHETFVSNPALVEEVLAALEEGSIDPENNPEDWIDDDQLANLQNPSSQFSNLDLSDLIAQHNPNLQNSQLTPEDENNVIYLMGLGGYTRPQALEAYIVCNKNVEMAANLLLDGN